MELSIDLDLEEEPAFTLGVMFAHRRWGEDTFGERNIFRSMIRDCALAPTWRTREYIGILIIMYKGTISLSARSLLREKVF